MRTTVILLLVCDNVCGIACYFLVLRDSIWWSVSQGVDLLPLSLLLTMSNGLYMLHTTNLFIYISYSLYIPPKWTIDQYLFPVLNLVTCRFRHGNLSHVQNIPQRPECSKPAWILCDGLFTPQYDCLTTFRVSCPQTRSSSYVLVVWITHQGSSVFIIWFHF